MMNWLEQSIGRVCYLVWQTLHSCVLQKALPETIDILQSGIHLNRASPLRQIKKKMAR